MLCVGLYFLENQQNKLRKGPDWVNVSPKLSFIRPAYNEAMWQVERVEIASAADPKLGEPTRARALDPFHPAVQRFRTHPVGTNSR